MGIASSLFYSSNDPNKQTLHRRIIPSDEQIESQKGRWNNLAEHLVSDLRDQSGYSIRTWLQGSYKFGTQIRPARKGEEFDIDLGVYLEWEGTAEDGHLEPREIKDMVQGSLLAYDAEDIEEVVEPPKTRCGRIRFTGAFHIDVPAYHLDPERDARMLATEEFGWEDSDPKALYVWFVDQFDDEIRVKARRHIRYLKIWAALHFQNGPERPSSTLLTVLVAEAVNSLDQDELAADDDALSGILEEMVQRLDNDRSVSNPASNDYEDLAERLSDDAFKLFLDKLRTFRDTSLAAVQCRDTLSAVDKWSEAFEHFFPMPEEDDLQEVTGATAQLPVQTFILDVYVHAVAKNNPQKNWRDMNGIGPIPKNCQISFSIANPDLLPANATTQWMVRNEGDEAEAINDLGHKAGTEVTASEHSAYKGTHYMDCVVRQHGVVIGVRRIPVSISSAIMPRRNPTSRPAYVRHRRRR